MGRYDSLSTHCGPISMRSMVNVYGSGVCRNGSVKPNDPAALSETAYMIVD